MPTPAAAPAKPAAMDPLSAALSFPSSQPAPASVGYETDFFSRYVHIDVVFMAVFSLILVNLCLTLEWSTIPLTLMPILLPPLLPLYFPHFFL